MTGNRLSNIWYIEKMFILEKRSLRSAPFYQILLRYCILRGSPTMPDVCCTRTTGVRKSKTFVPWEQTDSNKTSKRSSVRLVTLLRHLSPFPPFVRHVRIAKNLEISNRAFSTTRLGSASLLSLRTPFYEEEWVCVCVCIIDFRKLKFSLNV